jgi:hypothetical protein
MRLLMFAERFHTPTPRVLFPQACL